MNIVASCVLSIYHEFTDTAATLPYTLRGSLTSALHCTLHCSALYTVLHSTVHWAELHSTKLACSAVHCALH